jgi:hypothetical protein
VLQDVSYRTEGILRVPIWLIQHGGRIGVHTVHRNVSYNTEEERGTLRESVCLIQHGRRRGIHSVHQNASYNTEEVRAHCRDSPLSYNSHICNSAILVCVMSLWDARNRTTSRFSFLMGTISRRHQNGVPETEDQNVLTLWSRSSSKYYLNIQSVPQRKHNASPLQISTGWCCLRKWSLIIMRIVRIMRNP